MAPSPSRRRWCICTPGAAA
uniref:Uncharacterized protein n=1 Tax=Arundo donax TaxID=35708 RepID=A0A0A9BPN6_ARUDO